jgi:hypothetical protein
MLRSLAEGAMVASFINNPKHWRERAEEMRALAEEVNQSGVGGKINQASDFSNSHHVLAILSLNLI